MKLFTTSLSLVRRHTATALLASAALLMLGTAAHAQTAISNLGQSVSPGTAAIGRVSGGENHRWAFTFTTGSTASSFDLTSITFNFDNAQGSPSLSVGLYSSFNAGTIAGGVDLVTSLALSSGNPLADGNAVFSGMASLAPATTYYLLFDAGTQSPGNTFIFSTPNTYNEDSGGLPGWSIGDGGYQSFPSQTSTWAFTGTVGLFSVQASEASAIPEPSTYAAMAGAAALGLAVWRRRQQKQSLAA